MTQTIKNYDVQSVVLNTDFENALRFLSDPVNLPLWTAAFKEANNRSALLVTPKGELRIGLTTASSPAGNIDWSMTMPDGTKGNAYSRLHILPDGKVLYTFVLLVPPGPIEVVEGTLAEQKKLLAGELTKLQSILDK